MISATKKKKRNRALPKDAGLEHVRPQSMSARRRRGSSDTFVLNRGIPLLVAFGAAAVLAFCCLGLGSRSATPTPATSAAQTNGASNAAGSQTARAPDFTLPLLGGGTFHLAGASGHPVVLYFMAPTCATCAQGSQQLAQVMRSAGVAGATALAIDVNSGDHPADLQAFVQAVGQPAATALRWGIDTNDAITTAYGVQTLETMVVINAHGQIVAHSDSPLPPDQLVQLLKQAG
jgi:peroxiredoxin